jgi:arginyl-tRNA synthetase
MIKDYILNETLKTIESLAKEGKLGELKNIDEVKLSVGIPKNVEFGDYAINVAPLARLSKMAPPAIANAIHTALKLDGYEINVVRFLLSNTPLTEQ